MIVLPTTFMNKQALIFKHVPIGIEISKPSRCQKSTVEWKTCINEAIQTKKKVTSKLLDGGQRFDARTENFMAMVVVCTMLNLHVSILLESSFSNHH